MKEKKRKGFITSVADPLSDDDFDLEVKAAAKEYAEVQRQIARREQVREENKRRKQRGEAVLPLPRLPAQRKGISGSAIGGGRGSTPGVSDEDEEEEDKWSNGRRTPKRQRLVNDEELTYEGQVILDFDPLYALAGLPDPHGKNDHKKVMRQKVINRLMGNKPDKGAPPRPSTPLNSVEDSPSVSGTTSGEHKLEPLSSDTVEEHAKLLDEEEAPEGEYEDDDDVVVVPWGEMVKSDDILDQGIYSDEELFTGMKAKNAIDDKSFLKPDQDDISLYRPVFAFSPEQAEIGPYFLDGNNKDIAVPASINRFLKNYQQIGAQFMYDHYMDGIGGVLGDDMGLGKTIQVIAFLSAVMRKSGTAVDHQRRKKLVRHSTTPLEPRHWPTALIVCPKSLVANWSRELDTWGYFEYAVWKPDNFEDVRTSFLQGFLDIVLTSYDTARNTISHLKDLPLSVVIADEAHRMKEPRAQATLALKQIHCRTCFALTGTLVQNRMDEMWSVLDFQWRSFAVNPIKKGHRSQGTAEEVVSAIMRLGIVNQRILPHFYLRRDKRLIAHELPEKRDMVVFCPLARRQIAAYQALIDSEDVQFLLRRNDSCSCGSGKGGEAVKDVLLKNISALQKVANHFGLLYHAKDDSQHTREINRHFFRICTGQDYDTKQHNVVQAALDPENCGKWTLLEQLLIQWRREPTKDKVAGFAFDMLTGEAGNAERMEMVDRFQDENQDNFILLISTLAGGVGLNLTAANKVVIFDPSWTMDRAFRIGQKRTVDVYRLIAQGTLEELKYERQIHKQQRARQLNNGTFEPRIHQGFDGARNAEDQGELFGAHNIFRFDPKGFVSNNLERVRLAEDQFVQDLIQAEFNDSENEDEQSDGEAGKKMRDDRKARELTRAQQKRATSHTNQRAEKREHDLVNDILGDEDASGSPKKENEDVLGRLGVTTHLHETAFRDSPEERAIYEIGVQVLRNNPQMAKRIKANDLGKLGRTIRSSAGRRITSDAGAAGGGVVKDDEEPWQKRIQERKKERESDARRVQKVLAELSD
ncbi:hypothetical protein IAR55_003013 [Kwoniella newhampshirensis]|uniref:DNA excision repair protein ERCC-6 n=1 Tax=Kwoniella newhampshirensis TaxID=1651941 RepID=A0AAW0YSA2_9TREE